MARAISDARKSRVEAAREFEFKCKAEGYFPTTLRSDRMKKTILMLMGFAVVLAAGVACFTPSSKRDPTSPVNAQTNSIAAPSSSR